MENEREQILNGFQLNSDTLWEMRRVLEGRPQYKFSEGLSDEAKLVIQQLKEESKLLRKDSDKDRQRNHYNRERRMSKTKPLKTNTNEQRNKNHVTYVDSLRKSSLRLERDITDPDFNEMKLRKRALGGGPVQSAMETIEIVNACEPEVKTEDDFAIEETAKHNSVEKCIVWMEVNDNSDDSESVSGAMAE